MKEFKKFTMYDYAHTTCSNRAESLPYKVETQPYDPHKVMNTSSVIVHVEGAKNFILRTNDEDYTLDFQHLIKDYGIEA